MQMEGFRSVWNVTITLGISCSDETLPDPDTALHIVSVVNVDVSQASRTHPDS
jgi:hypothetical protein